MARAYTQRRKYYDEAVLGARRKFALPSLIISLHNKLKKWAKSPHEIAFNLLEPGQKILDIGCGDGQFLALVKDKFNELYGIDISPLAIEKARNYCLQMGVGERLKLILWDVENGLPFEDSIFDAVTCLAVLEHVFYPPSLLKEISRVLKVGGCSYCKCLTMFGFCIEYSFCWGKFRIVGA